MSLLNQLSLVKKKDFLFTIGTPVLGFRFPHASSLQSKYVLKENGFPFEFLTILFLIM